MVDLGLISGLFPVFHRFSLKMGVLVHPLFFLPMIETTLALPQSVLTRLCGGSEPKLPFKKFFPPGRDYSPPGCTNFILRLGPREATRTCLVRLAL